MSGKAKTTSMSSETATTGPEPGVRAEGQSIFDQVKALTGGSSKWQPYTGERVADYGADMGTAHDLITGLNKPSENLAASGSMLDRIRAGLRPEATVADFMSPYTEGVLSPTLRKLKEARDATRISTQAAATSSGAFGDARHGFEDAETNRRFMEATGDATNRAYADAFDKGQGQLNREREQASGLAKSYEGLDSALFNRDTALGRYFADFANRDRTLRQAKDDVAFSDFNEARDAPKRELEQLMQLLNLMPQSKTQTSQGIKTQEKPDNTGMALAGKLAGTALGAIFAPMTGGLSLGLGSLLGGGLGGGGGGDSRGDSATLMGAPDSAFNWN